MEGQANSASFIDNMGLRQEVTLDVTDYHEAGDAKKSLAQFYASKYPTNEDQPTALEQFAQSAGLRLRSDVKRGIQATSMKEIFHGMDKSAVQSNGIPVRGTGQDRQTTTGRILFPEIMMQLMNEILYNDYDDFLVPWEAAIAMRTSVTGPRVDQPRVNVTAPMSSLAQPIAQLSEPSVMVNITLSANTYTIPTKSIGLQVSDQALQAATIDFVALMLAAQARGERIARIEQDMSNIINGDVDYGINAIPFQNASTFDSVGFGGATIGSGAGQVPLTHRAWVKWLREYYNKLTITHAVMDIDAALNVEARAGRPTVFGDLSKEPTRMPGDYTIENLGIPTPKVLLLPTAVVGAARVAGFDAKYALHEITNISASYSAIENFIMRRSTAMRFDYGMALFKLYDDAFQGLNLAA